MRILLVKLGSMGDIVHALPFLSALKKAHPEADVHWLVERRFCQLLEGHPLIARVIEVDTLGWRRTVFSPSTWHAMFRGVRSLRRDRYDVVFDLQGLLKSSLLARLARSKRRVGFGEGSREPVSRYLLSESFAPSAEVRHVVRRNLYLLRALDITVSDADVPLVVAERPPELTAALEDEGTAGYFLLNPGAGWVTKRWSAERFGALACAIQELSGATPLVLWGPGERELGEAVVDASSNRARLAPATDLPGLVALLNGASLVVGGDTGPIHIAAGLGVPVVGLYGPSNPATHGPYGRRVATVWKQVECSPCHKRVCPGYDMQCLETMSVDDVLEKVRVVLDKKLSPPGGGGLETASG